MRSFVISTFVLTLALAPTAAMAQPPAQQPPSQPPSSAQPPSAQPPSQQPPASGQQPATQPPAEQQQHPPAGPMFTSDAGMIFNQIKPDHTADFEMVMGRVKEALAKSPDPKRRQQAEGWKVFKALETSPGGNVLYIFWANPAVKDLDYTVSKILAEAFPSEVQDLWKKYVDCYASGQNLVNLQLVTNMAPATPAGGGK